MADSDAVQSQQSMCGSRSQVKPACEIGNTQLPLAADNETTHLHGCDARECCSRRFATDRSIKASTRRSQALDGGFVAIAPLGYP
jgi:hypothetical protein